MYIFRYPISDLYVKAQLVVERNFDLEADRRPDL